VDPIPAHPTNVFSPGWAGVARFHIEETLSGLGPEQTEIDIDNAICGYHFHVGEKYLIYVFTSVNSHFTPGIRTAPLAEAGEDLAWFDSIVNAPATSDIHVRTNWPGKKAIPGQAITVEGGGQRYSVLADAVGDAKFTGLVPGNYIINAADDGDQPDDPRVELHAKRCIEVTLPQIHTITGRVTTKAGLPAVGVEVQLISAEDVLAGSAKTNNAGAYHLEVLKPGHYFLGVNLNHTSTGDTPYPRWYYPGAEVPSRATRVDFTRKQETRNYDLTLPDLQPARLISGIVLASDSRPAPRTVVTLIDSSRVIVARAMTDQDGRFSLHAFVSTPYQLYAVWSERTRSRDRKRLSAVPATIAPGDDPTNVQLVLSQPGNLLVQDSGAGKR
jgi:hypothetical protein